MPLHNITSLRIPEVYAALETAPDGLDPAGAQARLVQDGPNALPEVPAAPAWRRLSRALVQPMALLLWAAGGLTLALGSASLAVVIWLVVVLNTTFAYWQEHRAEQAVAALARLLPASARVVRAGQETHIPIAEIVAGDVLVLAQGDNIPADARVVEQFGLRTNQAALTGEAVAAAKTADASLRSDLTELECPNLVFAGSSVVAGTGRAVVYATGSLTQFGRLARLTQTASDGPSPLQQHILRLTRLISIAALVLGGVVFVVAALDLDLPLLDALVLSVGIIVATLPEGLRPTLTLSLAMAVERLARRGVIVKKLALMETLGRISVLCTDKSGTLTYNQMMVREVWVGGQTLNVTGHGYEPEGSVLPQPSGVLGADLRRLLEAALLCNNARLLPPTPERPRWAALGDQTEAALRVLALKGGADEQALQRDRPRMHEIPFEAARKRMSTIHRTPEGEVAYVKGGPREVLACCTHILVAGEVRPLDGITRSAILAANDDYARRARRVLALAYRPMPPHGGPRTADSVERELVFLGLAAMMDPPRAEVVDAIRVMREAGIRLVMITGDYGLTAESLAQRVGMLSGPARIVTGSDLDAMSDDDLLRALDGEVLFARMAPEHKLRVVAAYQARGEVVAFSGDGVNDAPALRKADIGIAMGVSGTDVAREAADIILTDDNFAAIAHAVEEGRAVYDNIRKFITYMLASNVPEIMPFIVTALAGIPLALSVAQILAIDLGTDLLPALALGAEPPEPEVMRSPPRRRSQPLLNRSLANRALWLGGIETLLCYAGFVIAYHELTHASLLHTPLVQWLPSILDLPTAPSAADMLASTVFFAGVVTAQVGNAITCRTEKPGVRRLGLLSNPLLWVGIAAEIAVALALIYVRPLAETFHHAALPPLAWVGLGLYAPLLYGLDRLLKARASRHALRRQQMLSEGTGL